MKKSITIIFFLFSIVCNVYGQQPNVRISTIQNQLEALKIESNGLDEPININITRTSLANFLLAIAKVHNLNINVAPDLNQIEIVNNFSNVAVDEIILFLVKEYDLDIDFTGNILSIKKYFLVGQISRIAFKFVSRFSMKSINHLADI